MKWLWRFLGGVVVVLAALFLIFRVPDTEPDEMRAKYGGAPSQFVELPSGLTVHMRDEGPRDAPVIMLLHGSNADLHTWQPWAEALRETYRVIRFDQIGHGLTGPARNGDYAQTSFVAGVNEVADTLGLTRFTLAGNSMGGGIALAYAMAHPERLDALVLVDASGAPIKREGGGNLFFKLAAIPGLNKVMAEITPRSLVEKSYSQSVYNQAIVTPQAVDRYWEMARYPGNRTATLRRFATPRSAFDGAAVAQVQVPTLVMWGEEDSLIPYEAAGWFMQHLPNATLVHYPDIGHVPMEEAPERSSADLQSWLGDVLSASQSSGAGTAR
ncbi:alpha/beta fold hydrolase [Qipengyuania marisflavi]|uniref:Alpha/beta hydrolase n=1 Tax=Qipengyuania marisflavi TaxID=2486356 RepID=A0A5S3P8X4_9SPHN|nr:alpha/beta hydrolase [Qipengyuania marisflavi]TMM48894.1 alpha/beta hydrolase [Qipengyuania marisflavi]